MSLIHLGWADPWERPSRLLGQQFGMELDDDDIFAPVTSLSRSLLGRHQPISRWPVNDSGPVIPDEDKFQVNVDVQQFAPDEITVKVDDDKSTITIEGKHEEKQDEHGFISRHFIRKYVLPEGHDVKHIQSNLSSDGVLTISAPKINKEDKDSRVVPIQHTGRPFKSTNKKFGRHRKLGFGKNKPGTPAKRNPRHK